MFKFGSSSLKNRAGVDARLIEISNRALEISILDFGHPQYSGLRTVEDQAKLFNDNKSKCDGVINPSFHQTGRALDVYAIHPETGKASWGKEHLAIVAVAFMQAANELGYKLEWGGLFRSFTDMPHFQLGE
jgi:peptidoglycan L-alanyl-D-glutamate endopeptidase CwlK